MPLTKYTESTLTPEERILYAGRGHNWSFVSSAIFVLIGIIMLFPPAPPEGVSDSEIGAKIMYFVDVVKHKFNEFMEGLPEGMQPMVDKVMTLRGQLMGLIFITIGSFLLSRALIKKLSVEKVITNRKIIYKKGLVEVDESEIPLNHVEGAKVKQSAFDRVINRGTVLVTGVGMEQIEVKKLADPNTFRKHAYMAIDIYEKEKHQRAAMATSRHNQREQQMMQQRQQQQRPPQQPPQPNAPTQQGQGVPPQQQAPQRPPVAQPAPPQQPAMRPAPNEPVLQPDYPQQPRQQPQQPQPQQPQPQPQQPQQPAAPRVNTSDFQAPKAPPPPQYAAPEQPFNQEDIPPVAPKWPKKDKKKD